MSDLQLTESQTFTWEVDAFSKQAEAKDTSYFFSSNDNKFFLRLYPQYEIRHMLNHVAVYLHRGPPYGKDLSVLYKVAMIDSNGDKCFPEAIKTDFNDKNKGLPANGGLYYISRDYLFDRANKLLSSDRLTIFCEVELLSDPDPSSPITETSPATTPIELTEENRKMIGDLDSLLESGKFADVTLVVGDSELKAHRAILASRSNTFDSMFESGESRYELADIDLEVAEHTLRYIYTGLVPPLGTYGREIFVAADKYQLDSLKMLAEDSLAGSLTVENVIHVLVLADQHSASKLKQIALAFITKNARPVMATEAWEQMGVERPLLLMQLYKDLVQVKK